MTDSREGARLGSRKPVLAFAIVFLAVLSSSAITVGAVDRSDGDFWVYEGDMEYDGIQLSGGCRCEFAGADTLTVGQEVFAVNVLKVTGSMSGETDESAGVSTSIEMVFDGYVYEAEGTVSTVKEDMHTWVDRIEGTDTLPIVSRIETRNVTTFSPAFLTGFVDGETVDGDEWEETANVTCVSSTGADGDLDTSTCESEETYSISAVEATVETETGTFACLEITVTNSSGDHEVYCYSSEVGCWVRISLYSHQDAAPYLTLHLTEYQYSGESHGDTFVVVGAVVLVMVVVVVVLLMRRRGREPAEVSMRAPPPTG